MSSFLLVDKLKLLKDDMVVFVALYSVCKLL